MYGSHLSIAKGLFNAANRAAELGMDTVQIFTKSPSQWGMTPVTPAEQDAGTKSLRIEKSFSKNQQQWRVRPLGDDERDAWLSAIKGVGFEHTVIHDSYLINLASPDEALRRKSIDLFAEEIRRAEALKVPYLVTHPGAHLGKRDDPGDETIGVKRVADALTELLAMFPKGKTTICLESTAGQGSSLGHRLEHLRDIMAGVKSKKRLAVCLDTAHLFAAGYDFRGEEGYAKLVADLERTIGVERVKVWHLNDSKKPLGSRVDRHEHIGHGTIGLEGFQPIVRDARWKRVPKILETAKEDHESGRAWDSVNLETLEGLAR